MLRCFQKRADITTDANKIYSGEVGVVVCCHNFERSTNLSLNEAPNTSPRHSTISTDKTPADFMKQRRSLAVRFSCFFFSSSFHTCWNHYRSDGWNSLSMYVQWMYYLPLIRSLTTKWSTFYVWHTKFFTHPCKKAENLGERILQEFHILFLQQLPFRVKRVRVWPSKQYKNYNIIKAI